MKMIYVRIRHLREDSDLSQIRFAQILCISQRSLSHYENGTREIPINTLIKIADYFDCSIDYLLERTSKRQLNR